MTPEIEQLRAEWQDAKAARESATALEKDAMDALDAKIAEWAMADLKARGIEIGVTSVEGVRWMPREGQKPFYQRDHVAVIKVTARGGIPRYQVQKLTKTGALSKAYGALDGAYVMVRKVGEA